MGRSKTAAAEIERQDPYRECGLCGGKLSDPHVLRVRWNGEVLKVLVCRGCAMAVRAGKTAMELA